MPENNRQLIHNEQTNNFLNAIQRFAEEQKNKVVSEAEEFKAQEIKKAEDEGLKEAFELIQREMTSMKNEIAKKTSKRTMEGRKKLFERRIEITEEVFGKVRDKLISFTKTSDYKKYILTSVKSIAEVLKSDDITIYVKADDLKYSNDIISAIGLNCKVAQSGNIEIGGVKGYSVSLGLVADETLDTKLESQKDWFTANCGMKI